MAPAWAGGEGRVGAGPLSESRLVRALTSLARRQTSILADHRGPVVVGVDGPVSGEDSGAPGRQSPNRSRRLIQEPYRQAFGRARTLEYGRPAGWVLLSGAIEKIFFPTILLIMILAGNWHGVALTVAFETTASVLALVIVTRGQRLEYLVKGLAVAPIRYVMLASDLVVIARFATDLWLTNNRRWRK